MYDAQTSPKILFLITFRCCGCCNARSTAQLWINSTNFSETTSIPFTMRKAKSTISQKSLGVRHTPQRQRRSPSLHRKVIKVPNNSIPSLQIADDISADMVAAMENNNLSFLLKSKPFRQTIESKLSGVSHLGPDANDLAGKLPLSIAFSSLGIEDVLIDRAPGSIIFGNSDGFIKPLKDFVEIKGASAKKRVVNQGPKAMDQYEFNNIRLKETCWKHLFLVCRPEQPKDWLMMEEYERCGFWLGYTTRDRLIAELGKENSTTSSENSTVRATVSPGATNPKNPLGRALTWVKFEDITKEWFEHHVLCIGGRV